MTGGTGLVGKALTRRLHERGDTVGNFVRGAREGGRPDDVTWNPATGEMELERVEGVDAVVNLAGASIGEGRWGEERKRVLRESRVDLTRNLVRSLARLNKPPHTLISASAVGFYGDRGDETLTEESASGSDFLAELARDWEAEAMKAEEIGARVAITRFGIILAKNGGALPRMLFPFKAGLGGKLGSGKQWMSWVELGDVVSAIVSTLDNPLLRGPLNVTAPNPVRNVEFTKTLGKVLHRPTIFPVPKLVISTLMGEMGRALLLSSQRAIPEALGHMGFEFRFEELEGALKSVLEKD
jgi:uncharacterized protein